MTMTWFFTPKKKAQPDTQSTQLKQLESEHSAAKQRLNEALDELLNETMSRKAERDG